MLETALAPKNDPYTCTIAGPGSYESELYWMECADIASSTTLSNSIVRATNNTEGGLGAIAELNYSATNRFGGTELCVAQDSGELARVGDGTIDTFDISGEYFDLKPRRVQSHELTPCCCVCFCSVIVVSFQNAPCALRGVDPPRRPAARLAA